MEVLEVSAQNFRQLSCSDCLLPSLESCICPGAISRRMRQRNSIKCCANFGKIAMKTPAKIRQVFGEGNMSRTRKSKTHRDEIERHVKSKVKSIAHHFLWHQGNCSQRIRPGRLGTKRPVSHTTVTWKCGNTSPRTLATKSSMLHHTNI
jgi:hypothetical protein